MPPRRVVIQRAKPGAAAYSHWDFRPLARGAGQLSCARACEPSVAVHASGSYVGCLWLNGVHPYLFGRAMVDNADLNFLKQRLASLGVNLPPAPSTSGATRPTGTVSAAVLKRSHCPSLGCLALRLNRCFCHRTLRSFTRRSQPTSRGGSAPGNGAPVAPLRALSSPAMHATPQ